MQLTVSNLSPDVTEEELRALLEAAGGVSSITIPADKATGTSRGFAFDEMHDDAAGQKAIDEVNGAALSGRSLRIVKSGRPAGSPSFGARGPGRQSA
ncbi:RNA recognition motif domain-containing protein [Streptomyces anulatus]|uniref:RNA recognition motif domain-containing protein n=1 Tax=Streptomyces anulatus TaxID=1892 RepID=UPI00386C8093|nr:RNA-binding protein [Streptomyces anulatus]